MTKKNILLSIISFTEKNKKEKNWNFFDPVFPEVDQNEVDPEHFFLASSFSGFKMNE